MTKTEFIQHFSDRYKLPRNDAERIVNAFLDSVEDALFRDGRIALPGFGSFSARERRERQGKNPQTGEAMVIAARNTVRFKPAAALTDLVN